ncbi:Nuclear envelope integral membrane protein 1 [Dissostichus eleginoides]|uniref:Nuclear envelope integral membrane protein 1 n=1 Tax=Dissostichus eleginoides TaxID=100907 RepID=A0AAD9CB18_DISEL|nr:Nuclear envelope integral membrane protein 1 [Dissostichus eleginoides]
MEDNILTHLPTLKEATPSADHLQRYSSMLEALHGGSAVRWNFKSRVVHPIHEGRGSLCIAFDKIMTEPGWDKETIAQSAALKQKLEDFDFTFQLGGLSVHFRPHRTTLPGSAKRLRAAVRWKTEPRRLLTEEEFQREAEEQTRKALEDLRKNCSSPEFRSWRTVARLTSPKRHEG